jgi:predicted ribosome quality control (RQC) complex YloA/Tae2 family protein
MSEYKIERFDVVMDENLQKPMIYIKPDSELLEFARKNNYSLLCEINNSGTKLDGKKISGDMGKYMVGRPNFFKQNDLYTVTLLTEWCGYPSIKATPTVTFYGILVHEYKDDDSNKNEEIIEKYEEEEQDKNQKLAFFWPLFLIFLLFFICFLFII